MKHFIITIALLTLGLSFATAQGGNKILWIQDFPGFVYDCAFMPDENYIIVAHDTLLEVRRTVDQSLVRAKNFSPKVIYSFDVSKDGRYVAIGGSGGKIKLLDINTFDILKEYEEESAFSVNFSPDSKMLAFAYGDSAIVVDVETGRRLYKTYGTQQDQRVGCVQFSPDGKYLAMDFAGGTDKKIYVFETKTWTQYAVFNEDDWTPHGAAGSRLIFSPNSEMLLAEPCAGYLFRIWDLYTKQNISNAENVPLPSSGLVTFFKDNNTLFWRAGEDKSNFYSIKDKVVKIVNISPPISRTAYLNSDETLLLGAKLCLTQIDKSILSAPENNPSKSEDFIYPNPTTGEIQINIELPYNDKLEVNIIDLAGKIIKEINYEVVASGLFEMSYNASDLPLGIYFLKFTQRDFIRTFKLVKEGK